MARKKHLINVHTSTGTTAPTGASLYLGEIAVQHTPNDPALWIKVGTAESSTQYEKFIGKTEITNMVSTTSGLVEDLSAVTLTGVTMNNSPVSVTDHVANLGTVITAETQLSTAKTGTGNVVGSISVSNHKITSTMFSAASADQIAKLSAGTISLVASSAASVYSSAVTYINSAITGLDSSTAVTAGKYITGIAIADGKISGITEATLPSAPAITATTAGTGNVFTAVSTTGHSMTFTKGMTAAAKTDLDALSAATTAHTSNGDIHVTANQKTAWTNGANSGASAYTMVQNLSAVTLTGVTMNGSPASVANKVADLGTVITAETQLSTAVTGNGNVFSSIQVANHKITMGKDVTALTGVSTPNNDNYISVSVASNSAITVGEKNAVVADKTALSNVSATGSLVDAKAVKDYVADQITSSVDYKGATSTLPSTAAVGDLYITSANIAIPANKSATGVAVTAETGDFIIARTTGTWDVIEKNLDGAITGSLTADTLTLGAGTNNVKSLENGSNGQILTVGSNGPQWTTGVLTDTATTLAGHYIPTGSTTGGTTATTSASAVKGIVYDGKGHITSVVTGSVLTAQTSLTTANGTTGNNAAAVITGITTGGTAGHQLTLNKSNKVFSASTSDSALTVLSAITSLSAQTTILGPTYSYSGLPYIVSSTSLADAYSALTYEMIKDEKVVAAALNDLNVRVDEISAATGDNTELLEYIQENEEVVAGALNNLNERVGVVETRMTGDYIPITGYQTATGTSEEELSLEETDTVNEALGKLQKQMLDNEESIAAGLNDLNTRLDNVDEAISHSTGITQLSGAVRSLSAATYSISDGLSELYNNVNNNTYGFAYSNQVTNLSAATHGKINQLSAATQYIGKSTLTINMNGVEQGKYTPLSGNTTINLTAATEVTGADVLLTGYELATGTTEEELAIVATDTVNEAFGKIQKQNYDNEAVIAGSLNDLDDRITALELSGGSGGDVEELSGAVVAKEIVIAAALNDLNARIVELSGNTGAETDPIFMSSPAATITQEMIDEWNEGGGGGEGAVTAVTVNGTGNAITDATFSNKALTLTKGNVQATINDLETIRNGANSGASAYTAVTALSAATTAHTANTTVHITSTERTRWQNAWTSGVSAYTRVNALSAATTAHTADTTVHVTQANKDTWNGKQDAISDLTAIRNGANSGASAYTAVTALSAATTAHTSSTTSHVSTTDRTRWQTGWVSGSSAYTLVNNLSAVTVTGVSAGGTNVTVTSKVAAIPSASTNTFGVVKTGNFITNTNGSIAVTTGTNATSVARGDHSHSGYATTGTLNTHTAVTIASRTSSQMHLPTVSATDNGKILRVVNGAWALVDPTTIYNGSNAPDPSLGTDGDIYLQTS